MGAYKRDYAGAPEIKLVNRFIESMPSNLREQMSLLARPGTNLLTSAAADTSAGLIRRLYTKIGLFNNDLFIVSGGNFYRYTASGGELIPITGFIGSGIPKLTWDSGIGYQHLFIADGTLLQYYAGGSHATGTLTGSYSSSQVLDIGGTYYGYNAAVDTNSPDGSAAHPWLCNPGTDPITAMANMLNYIGTPGADFSTNLRGANTEVTAVANGGPPASSLTLTAITDLAAGNLITTTISGSGMSWGAATLAGGGVHSLFGVYVPTGEPINAVCSLDHYVMASVGGSNKMFFIQPGDVTIDTLNFFSKESNPDPIYDLLTFGDTFLACGPGSIENWYATGDLNAPFAPIEGRTTARGIIDGSLVLVQDTPVLLGSDGVVYTYTQGLTRVSTHGIEERIREQLRSAAGIT